MNRKLNDVYDNISEEMFERADHDVGDAEKTGYSNYSYWRSTFKIFISKKTTIAVLAIMTIFLLIAVFQPLLPDQKLPTVINIDPETGRQVINCQPCKEFWLGTNTIGQDMWSRIWSGSRTSLFIGLVVGLFEAVFGIIIGAVWGYVKSLDQLITQIYNILNNIPSTIIMVLMSYILRPGMGTIIIAMCVTGWLPMARFVRNQIIIIRDREYNLASRCLGTPTKRMILKNLLPFLVSVVMLRIALAIPSAIGNEVFLTYIGLGLPVNIPSLGNLVNEGRSIFMIPSLRYQLIYPSIALSIITISFYILGNTFADAADPKNHV